MAAATGHRYAQLFLQDIVDEPVRGLRQPVVVRPQGIAAMMLRTGEMQRIGCLRLPRFSGRFVGL